MQKREGGKQIWLISYGSAADGFIDHEMLSSSGIIVDECYSVLWRESKYTLFHLARENRVRRSAVVKAMHRMKGSFGIVGSEIFGFDSVSCNAGKNNNALESHPGFKFMVETLNTSSGNLIWWMKEGNVETNRKGLLWKHMDGTDPDQMTKAQLVRLVREWVPSLQQKETKQPDADDQMSVESVKQPRPPTRQILMGYRLNKSVRDTMKIVIKKERDLNRIPSLDGSGEIYAAWNPTLMHLYKLGFTFKDA